MQTTELSKRAGSASSNELADDLLGPADTHVVGDVQHPRSSCGGRHLTCAHRRSSVIGIRLLTHTSPETVVFIPTRWQNSHRHGRCETGTIDPATPAVVPGRRRGRPRKLFVHGMTR